MTTVLKGYDDVQDATGTTILGGGGEGSGMVLIEEQTPSAASEASFTTGIDSDHDVYLVEIIGLTVSDDDVELRVELQSGASFQTTGYIARAVSEFTGATSDPLNSVTTYIPLTADAANHGIGNAAGESANFRLFLYNPASTSTYAMVEGSGLHLNPGTNALWARFWGTWTGGTGAVTGIRIFPATGTISAVAIRLWGLPKT